MLTPRWTTYPDRRRSTFPAKETGWPKWFERATPFQFTRGQTVTASMYIPAAMSDIFFLNAPKQTGVCTSMAGKVASFVVISFYFHFTFYELTVQFKYMHCSFGSFRSIQQFLKIQFIDQMFKIFKMQITCKKAPTFKIHRPVFLRSRRSRLESLQRIWFHTEKGCLKWT
jgi:hypothetical protein